MLVCMSQLPLWLLACMDPSEISSSAYAEGLTFGIQWYKHMQQLAPKPHFYIYRRE